MDKLLTAEEVAELLKVNTEWVWAQARAGRPPRSSQALPAPR